MISRSRLCASPGLRQITVAEARATCDYSVDIIDDDGGNVLVKGDPSAWLRQHLHPAHCEPFLRADRTHPLTRAFWLPDALVRTLLPRQFHKQWSRYCWFARRGSDSTAEGLVDRGVHVL